MGRCGVKSVCSKYRLSCPQEVKSLWTGLRITSTSTASSLTIVWWLHWYVYYSGGIDSQQSTYAPNHHFVPSDSIFIIVMLVLVLGMCFFTGGLKYSEQGFGASTSGSWSMHDPWCDAVCWLRPSIIGAAQLNSSLLTISVIAILLPAAFNFTSNTTLSDSEALRDILSVSHGVCIILCTICLFLKKHHF